MKKILGYSILVLLGGTLFGQSTRLEKSFIKAFSVSTSEKVDITNKYGEVIVRTWLYDSVKIEVKVQALGKTQEIVNKEIDKVNIELSKVGSTIMAETSFEQNRKSFFGELASQVTEASKTVMGGSKTTIDYQIWMPANLPLVIKNKYGDIYLASMENQVDLTLSHGNLRGERIDLAMILNHSFGKHSFEYVKEGDLTLRGAESKINEALDLSIESSSSTANYGKIDRLQLNSRNDKYFIDQVDDILGEGSFTDLSLNLATKSVRLDFNYGDIFLSSVNKQFDNIKLKGKSCDINVILNQGSYIETKLIGADDRMILPNSMRAMRKEILEDGRLSLEGHVGNTNTFVSNLNVNVDAGNLIISIKETDMFTNRD